MPFIALCMKPGLLAELASAPPPKLSPHVPELSLSVADHALPPVFCPQHPSYQQ